MASSMASLVPDPMEKCAVALASPISTTLPAVQRAQRTVGKLRHTERLTIRRWPCSSSSHTRRRRLVVRIEAGAREGLRIGLQNPGRAAGLVLIAMGDENAVLGLAEEE